MSDKDPIFGRLLYRCLRCGAEFDGAGVSDVEAAVLELSLKDIVVWPGAVMMRVSSHRCEDGKGVGLACCIGGNFEQF